MRGLEIHVLASGSDGNSAVFCADGTSIMVDAGLSGRALERLMGEAGLDPGQMSALLITHEHGDHCRGAGVLARRYGMPVYATGGTLANCRIGKVEDPRPIAQLGTFQVGPVEVKALPIPHNASEPCAFSLSYRDRRCLVATDLGRVTPGLRAEMEGTDLLMMEANHDLDMLLKGDYPTFLKRLIRGSTGHLSNAECAQALRDLEDPSRKVFLAHLSRNNNTPELAMETVGESVPGHDLCCLEGEVRTVSI
ncbi:MAG: MBL fold metallo-hydrolase [Methanomassiliicoccales archaeon]